MIFGCEPKKTMEICWQSVFVPKTILAKSNTFMVQFFRRADTMVGTNISQLRRRKIIFKSPFGWDMLVLGGGIFGSQNSHPPKSHMTSFQTLLIFICWWPSKHHVGGAILINGAPQKRISSSGLLVVYNID